jgi:cytochrome P450
MRLISIQDGNILFGQAINLLTAEGPNDYPLKWMYDHPEAPLVRYIVAGSEWILVNSVQASRDILHTSCYSFEKPNWFRRIVGEIAGIGLVNADGDVHKGHRKLLNSRYKLNFTKSETGANKL